MILRRFLHVWSNGKDKLSILICFLDTERMNDFSGLLLHNFEFVPITSTKVEVDWKQFLKQFALAIRRIRINPIQRDWKGKMIFDPS